MFVDKSWILHYFKPGIWESNQNIYIYRKMGIKLFKKHLPCKILLDQDKTIKLLIKSEVGSALFRKEMQTRIIEWRHILGLIGFLLIVILVNKKMTTFDWIFLFILNLLVNIYPILLQRYNRIRILALLTKLGFTNPYRLS